MFYDFQARQKIRLSYHIAIKGRAQTQPSKFLHVAGNRLRGFCRLCGDGEPFVFDVDTGSPFTIVPYDISQRCALNEMTNARSEWYQRSENGTEALGPLKSVPWGGVEVLGEFHWVTLNLYEFDHHEMDDPFLPYRVMAFCQTEQSTPKLTSILLGLGGHGIERGGLCLNLARECDPQNGRHDAWLIGDVIEPSHVV